MTSQNKYSWKNKLIKKTKCKEVPQNTEDMYTNTKCPMYYVVLCSVLFCSFFPLCFFLSVFFSILFFSMNDLFIFSVVVRLVFFHSFSIVWSLVLGMISLPQWSIKKKQKILSKEKSSMERTNTNASHCHVFLLTENLFEQFFYISLLTLLIYV